MEKTFAEELYEIAQNAISLKEQTHEIVSPQSPQKRAEDFLEKLKIRLKVTAHEKVYFYRVLQVEFRKEYYTNLNLYEKLVFDGCRDLGLKPKIQELNGIGMAGGSSDGRWITVSWDGV